MKQRWILAAVGVLWALTAGAQQGAVLTAKKVTKGPMVDGKVDASWNQAKAVRIPVSGGVNLPQGSTVVSLKALYTDDQVFFLAQWRDSTQSFRRSPWEKQGDGTWKKLKDPKDQGGDNNLYYEDKFAMIWNINIAAFEQIGCMTVCHAGEPGKPYGNKYTHNPGEMGDMWHWKAVRTGPVGQIDDQYVDSTRYDKEKALEAGRHSDPKTGGGYTDNQTEDQKAPKFGAKGNKPAPPYWILDSEKEPLDADKYKAGAEVAGIIVSPFSGDRGDITAKAVYSKGQWTLEFSRKLTTGSKYDVQFTDMQKEYAFGVAVFDNAQVRHAFSGPPYRLAFGK